MSLIISSRAVPNCRRLQLSTKQNVDVHLPSYPVQPMAISKTAYTEAAFGYVALKRR